MRKRAKRRKSRKHIHAQNVGGPQIRRLRDTAGLTQEQFTARCNRIGFDVSRGTLAKIEAAVRCVSDKELLLLARVLRVGLANLYPESLRPGKRH